MISSVIVKLTIIGRKLLLNLPNCWFPEKLRWEAINVEGADDQMPKPRAGHAAVNVNIIYHILW